MSGRRRDNGARNVVGNYEDYPELLVRWYQYGTFTPTMRAHGLRKETEAWSYGKEAEAVISKYLKLRYTLMPYLYSLGKHTYDTGAPFMRALFMDFPNDPKVLTIGDQYMFGPAFLVAPVTEQGRESREASTATSQALKEVRVYPGRNAEGIRP